MRICILPLRALSFDERTVRALPFGKAEQTRLLAIGNKKRALCSLGALLALQSLTDHAHSILRTPEGKPYFDDPDAPAFSLSHSDTLAVAVLADDDAGSVGIDVEDIRPCPQATRIAKRFFTAAECAHLAEFPTDEAFLTLWTAKEAVAKMSGQALASALSAPTTSGYTQSVRLIGDGIDALLCLAAERPITTVEWLCPPTLQIFER